jgi:glycolate dehydrogenase FAD-binding subunit
MRPGTVEEAAALLREASAAGRAVRPVGAGTKLDWGAPGPAEAAELETAGLGRILEHNVGDFTAVLEAGVALSEAQAAFAESGQALALDPPFGGGGGGPRNRGPEEEPATIGGIIAANDSGPLRHRYGGVRDLVVGITVVLSDGTVAKAGGKVIKNVAGYDLGKLFAGSFGTLGLIASVAVRLHPVPDVTATATGTSDDPERLRAVVAELARRPLEAACLDVAWEAGAGRVLVRFGGATAERQAREAVALLEGLEGAEAVEDDSDLWRAQRARQRSAEGAVLKVSGRPTDLPAVLRAAEANGATVASRAALGLSWVALPPGPDLAGRVGAVRQALAPRACTLLDGGSRLPDPWPAPEPAALEVMERLKARFDPARIFRPGAFVGGI